VAATVWSTLPRNQTRVNLFQVVRFLADVFDEINMNMPPLQQSRRGLVARVSVRRSR
jgi:hypothetical protein